MTHYVIARSDLPIGFLTAQIVHAAGESSGGDLPPNTNAVVLSVPDEGTLFAIACQLVQSGIPHVAIREPDAPWNGQMTAIGIKPIRDRKRLKSTVGQLPLFGRELRAAV